MFSSLEEGIRVLESGPPDFAAAGMTPFFLDFRGKMQKAFPKEKVLLGWQWEGPVTTAWELLGERFMYDILDRPERMEKFLRLSTASMVEYCRFFCRVEGTGVLDTEPDRGRLCDDIAAMLPPRLWPACVLPNWEAYFRGPAPGRIVHCEDMRADQLGLLDRMNVADYDPGISPKLSPETVAQGTRVPFRWRLGSFAYRDMTCEDVRNLVLRAAAAGASTVFSYVEAIMCEEPTLTKVRAFVRAAKEAQALREETCGLKGSG